MSAYCFRAYSYLIILYFNVKWTDVGSYLITKKTPYRELIFKMALHFSF